MKRTRQVTLILMGLGATGLAGCGGDPKEEVFVFQNPQQCVAEKRGSDSECANEFIRAQGEHIDKAPRYENKADCERDFGEAKCEERKETSLRSTGGPYSSQPRSSFAPFMAGYMMGSLTNRTPPQPLYQFRGANDYRTPSGGTIPAVVGGRATGPRTVPASNLAAAPRAVTVSRGGFGSTAMATAHSSST